MPPHTSAQGKVLYAFDALSLPEGSHLETPTERSIGTLTQLRRELQKIRRDGYAVTRDELEHGLSAMAAPVRGRDGNVIAALGVSAPAPASHARPTRSAGFSLSRPTSCRASSSAAP